MKLHQAAPLCDWEKVFSDPVIQVKWPWYPDHLRNYGRIVEHDRERVILDREIPGELLSRLLSYSTWRFLHTNGYLRFSESFGGEDSLSAAEAVRDFGEEAVLEAEFMGLCECDRLADA